jgi:hypothetical protein
MAGMNEGSEPERERARVAGFVNVGRQWDFDRGQTGWWPGKPGFDMERSFGRTFPRPPAWRIDCVEVLRWHGLQRRACGLGLGIGRSLPVQDGVGADQEDLGGFVCAPGEEKADLEDAEALRRAVIGTVCLGDLGEACAEERAGACPWRGPAGGRRTARRGARGARRPCRACRGGAGATVAMFPPGESPFDPRRRAPGAGMRGNKKREATGFSTRVLVEACAMSCCACTRGRRRPLRAGRGTVQ